MSKTVYVVDGVTASAYGNVGTYFELKPFYTNKKSAQQRRRRALTFGIPNTWSGCGRVAVRAVWVREVKVR